MWPFKKKNIYKVTWKYDSTSNISYTEIIEAYDVAHAWRIIKRRRSLPITLVSMEEFK